MLAKKFAVGFGIAVILPMLIHYGVSTFSPCPRLEDYQTENYYLRIQSASPEEKARLEEERREAYRKYEGHRKHFERRLFFVAMPVGILAIIAGSMAAVQAVGTGLMFGGIFTLGDGYFWYWSALPDWLRFLSLLAAFIVLIFIGYHKLTVEQ